MYILSTYHISIKAKQCVGANEAMKIFGFRTYRREMPVHESFVSGVPAGMEDLRWGAGLLGLG